MTTVAQLIAALQKLPQDAEIECGEPGHDGFECSFDYAPVDVEYFTIKDWSSKEDRMKYPKMAGRVIVYLDTV